MPIASPPPIAAAQPSSGLERYRWKARLLVISAPTEADADLKAQRAALAADAAGLKERDLTVLELIGDRPPSRAAGLDVARARREAGLAADRFGVALIGKDGHVAKRETAPVTAAALFGVIDAMPMRQDELRRR